MGACYTGKAQGHGRPEKYKPTPPIQLEAVSEHSEIGKVYQEMSRDPNGLFIQRDNRKCFLRNNGIPIKQEKRLAVFDSLKYMQSLPSAKGY